MELTSIRALWVIETNIHMCMSLINIHRRSRSQLIDLWRVEMLQFDPIDIHS